MIDWYVEGVSFGNCNCNYGCPCQFEEKPTHGNCCGFEVFEISKGHFGDVKLDGLRAALLYACDEHRVRINILNGIEFEMAEIGSASMTATGKIQLDLSDSYGQFNLLRHSGCGVVH